MIPKRFIALLLTLITSCMESNSSSLKENAKSTDENTKVIKVADGDDVFPILLTGNGEQQLGYKLECADEGVPVTLLSAIGFSESDYELLPLLEKSSETVTNSRFESQPVLSCDAGTDANNKLFKVSYPENERLFVQFGSNVGKMNMLGCPELAVAMGFDKSSADPLDSSLAKIVSNLSDEFDINCIGKTVVEIEWDEGDFDQSNLVDGKMVDFELKAKSSNNEDLSINYSIVLNSCSWLNRQGVEAKFSGVVKAEENQQSCSLIVLASVEGLQSARPLIKSISFSYAIQKRAIVWQEPINKDFEISADFDGEITSLKAVTVDGVGNVSYSITQRDCDWLSLEGDLLTANAPSTSDTCKLEIEASTFAPNNLPAKISITVRSQTAEDACIASGFIFEDNTCVDPKAVRQIATGYSHSCYVNYAGNVKCWGGNRFGQLGNGSLEDQSTPVEVLNLTNVKQVSLGAVHSCAVTWGGNVKCWGSGSDGQLGFGVKQNSSLPVNVSGIASAVEVKLGRSHSCAVLQSGRVKCWGAGMSGALGQGKRESSTVPVDVVGIENAASLGLGGDHSCAVIEDGKVKCWGAGSSGQLGVVPSPGGFPSDQLSPEAVDDISDAIEVSAGGSHTCVRRLNGFTNCFGYGGGGALGQGENESSTKPVPVFGGYGATQISAGTSHGCLVDRSGKPRCWGGNYSGQLGIDGETQINRAFLVENFRGRALAVKTGAAHTCALSEDREIYCWGSGFGGALGNGETPSRSGVVRVKDSDIDRGRYFKFARDNGLDYDNLTGSEKSAVEKLLSFDKLDLLDVVQELDELASSLNEAVLTSINAEWNRESPIDLEQFLALMQDISSSNTSSKIARINKILTIAQDSLSARNDTICFENSVVVTLPGRCKNESSSRRAAREAVEKLQNYETNLQNLNSTLIRLGSFLSKGQSDFDLMYRTVRDLKVLRNAGFANLLVLADAEALLNQRLSEALEKTLQKDYVERSRGLADTITIERLFQKVKLDLISAEQIFRDRIETENSGLQKAKACSDKDALLDTIEANKLNESQILANNQLKLEDINLKIQQSNIEITRLRNEINLIDRKAKLWCSKFLKNASFEPPLSNNEEYISLWKSCNTFRNILNRTQWGLKIGSYTGVRTSVLGATDGDRRDYLNWERERTAYYQEIYDQRQLLKVSLSAKDQLEKTIAALEKDRSSLSPDGERISSQLSSLYKNLSFLETLCRQNNDVGLSGPLLTSFLDQYLTRTQANLIFLVDAIKFYQKFFGQTDLTPAIPMDRVLNTDTFTLKAKYQIYREAVTQAEAIWIDLKPRLENVLDNRIKTALIPISLPPVRGSRDSLSTALVLDIENLRTPPDGGADPSFSLEDINSCIASTIQRDMAAISSEINLDAYLNYPVPEGVDWTFESEKLLEWDTMPSFYGVSMRSTSSFELRRSVRRTWALWKYAKTLNRFWHANQLFNQVSSSENIETTFRFKMGLDSFREAERSFILGVYPINGIASPDGDFIKDNYYLSKCSAVQPDRNAECNNELESYNFAYDFSANASGKFFSANDSLALIQDMAELKNNFSSIGEAEGYGISFANTLRGAPIETEEFNLKILDGARTSSSEPYYQGSYLIISYVEKNVLGTGGKIDWSSRNEIAVPVDSDADRRLSDIYFHSREAGLFENKDPLDWITEQDSMTAECVAISNVASGR